MIGMGGVRRIQREASGVIAVGVLTLAGCGVVTTAPTEAATTSTTLVATTSTLAATTSTSHPEDSPSTTVDRPASSSTVPADSTSPGVAVESTVASAPPPPDRYPASVIDEVDADSRLTAHPVSQCRVDGRFRDVIEGEYVAPYPAAGEECLLGPAYASGAQFRDPSVELDEYGGWRVIVDLTPDGVAVWNQLAEMCFEATPSCPSQRIALVFDRVVITAPFVRISTFEDSLEITGLDSKEEAENLADALEEDG